MEQRNSNLLALFENMPSPLGENLFSALGKNLHSVTEIRFHCGKPSAVYLGKEVFFLSGQQLTPQPHPNGYCPTHVDLAELLARLCDYSLYAKEEELRNGYLTVRGGHRIGICTGYLSSGCVDYSAIGSINIRVAREVIGSGEPTANLFFNANCRGVLLAGPPMSGKTTVLRDAVRLLAGAPHYKKVSVIDERREVAACWNGAPTLDVGFADVLDGFEKETGLSMAVRSLSPDIIACDELVSENDARSLANAALSGVLPIATVHARSVEDVFKKPFLRPLFDNGCVSHILVLDGNKLGAVSHMEKVSGC